MQVGWTTLTDKKKSGKTKGKKKKRKTRVERKKKRKRKETIHYCKLAGQRWREGLARSEERAEEGDPYLHAAWPEMQRRQLDKLHPSPLPPPFAFSLKSITPPLPCHLCTLAAPVIARFSANYAPLPRRT